ncbi:glycosyltransferase [Amycolatopsis albispora]|uniref:Glycosyltransferase n=2 Tax=Amycolatopsis albispora TaxID=1804986 RepID=A0A344LKW7_9PSEU|nr:glycosyltransferase [Amycolatopsis albispora]
MRLLFSAGAGYSHIAPLLPLATAARDLGHATVFVTGPGAVGHLEAAGLHGVAVGAAAAGPQPWGRYSPAELAVMSAEEKLAFVVTVMAEAGAGGRLDDMLAFFRDWRPELVVAASGEFAAVAAAVVTGVPFAVHAIGPPKSAAVMAGGWAVVDELVRRFEPGGLPSRDNVPYLDIWPGGLRPAGVEWDLPNRWPVRPDGMLPVEGERPYPAPVVYVTAGTAHNTKPGVLEAMIGGVRDAGVDVVATIGRDGDLDRFGTQPGHVRITHFLPQERVLPHAEVVVCHAGAGTVLGALAHGKPLVLTPLATDQFDTAAQVADAGAGVVAEPSPDAVRAALGRVRRNPAYRAAAGVLAAEIAAMPPPVAVLERLTGGDGLGQQ